MASEHAKKSENLPMSQFFFLTAKSLESDRLFGLMAGGDDYLTKPFSYAELLGRVKSLLRRYRVYKGKPGLREKNDYIEIGKLKVHKEYHRCLLLTIIKKV